MLLAGKKIADQILGTLKAEVAHASIKPGLAVVLIGDEIESHKYVGLKEERAQAIGLYFEKHLFPATASEAEVRRTLQRLNDRPDIHGIIVQLPLPEQFDTNALVACIEPRKDADGFHPETLRQYLAGHQELCPVFPQAILALIQATEVSVSGERAVALVNSELFGQIITKALQSLGLEVTVILSGTIDRAGVRQATQSAKVVVTACGIPDLLTADMLSSDAIVIDGGNVHVDGKVRGDVDRGGVEGKVAWLSPVPGGVGPLTIAFLLKRTVQNAIGKNLIEE